MSPQLAQARPDTPMDLRERVLDPTRRDEISEALAGLCRQRPGTEAGLPVYAMNYYSPGLRDVTLGAHSRGLVGVSRYYPTLDPPVVVDFEPQKPEKWWFEQKVQHFLERGILYFPIQLYERLTVEQFAARFRDLKHALDRHGQDERDQAALDNATLVEASLMDEALVHQIDLLASARADDDRDPMGRTYGGAVRLRKLEQHKRDIVDAYRERLRYGGLDRDGCARELADEIARRRGGQVHPPVAS